MKAVTEFAPAPWRVVREDYPAGQDVSFEVLAANGRLVAQTVMREIGKEDRWIAEDEALCGLIVAAPDLYAAAKRALAVLKAQGEAVLPGNVLGALDAALKKASAAREGA